MTSEGYVCMTIIGSIVGWAYYRVDESDCDFRYRLVPKNGEKSSPGNKGKKLNYGVIFPFL